MIEKIIPDESENKPLHEMSLKELQKELAFREGMRYRFDREDPQTHKALQSRLDEVRRVIRCIENGKPVDKDNEDDK
jgi:hypothetical protein